MQIFKRFGFADGRINNVIKLLTYSDLLIFSAWGLIMPILSIFMITEIEGGTVAVAGLAATIYLITRSIVQLPIAKMIDDKRGEFDDYRIMVLGTLLIALVAFLMANARLVWHIYSIQALYGIAIAMVSPPWNAIFTRHIDKNREGYEWSLYTSLISLGSGLTAGLGGFLAQSVGYKTVFIIIGFSTLIGAAFLGGLTEDLKKR